MKWNLSDIAQAVGGYLVGPDQAADGVSTDSRQVAAGSLFVALKGERFDAHDFLVDVQRAQPAGLLVADSSKVPAGASAVVVDDTRLALGRLAGAWRARFAIPLIGITGSNGKTTTKEMVAAILRASYGEEAVLATQGNFNNDIGLPLTLLGLNAGHAAAVIEMGMNHPGEIAYLTRIARPTAAVVTNAQRAHLEGMGDLQEVAREKGSIFEGLLPQGVAAIALDSPYAELWTAMAAGYAQLGFSSQGAVAAGVWARIEQRGLAVRMTLQQAGNEVVVDLHVPGEHNARNALAAAAVCLAAGVSLAEVQAGLSSFRGVKGRLQTFALEGGAILLDDTYNANPDSVRAGIDVLAATVGRKILVLGDMGEIGDASAQCHDEVGGYAKSQGVDALLTLGESSQVASRAFGEGAQHFKQVDSLLTVLRKKMTADTTVLVKGSRFMKMERISEGLRQQCAARREGE